MTALNTSPLEGSTAIKIDWDVEIPMADGGLLRANVYRPEGSGQVPLIVNMGPYSKDLPMSSVYPARWAQMVKDYREVIEGSSGKYFVWEVPDPERWIPHGYALAHIDARGTGRSPGMWSPFSTQEASDFAEAIEWLAAQPWCSGRVGVAGVSYYAIAAWQVAQRQPRHLAAVIPWHGAADPYRESFRHGGILSNTFRDGWWYRWLRNQHGSPHGRVSPFTGEVTTGPDVLDLRQLEDLRVDIPAEVRRHELFDDWMAVRKVDWSRVTVPFLSVGSWGNVGLHLRGNVEAFRHAASKDKWLMLLAAKQARVERFHDRAGVEVQRQFFDRYLKDIDNGWESRPRVFYELREPDGSRTVRTAKEWPIECTEWRRLYLDVAARSMSTQPPAAASQIEYWPAGDGVSFKTTTFDRRTEVVGPLAIRLMVSTTASDLDLFAAVRVLDADGCLVRLHRAGTTATRGWLRLSHRELDEDSSSIGAPVHTHERLLEVVPGQRYTVDIEVWPTSLVVPEGGALTLTIQGIDAVDTEQTRHNDSDDRPNSKFAGWTTVYTDCADPSWLLIPVAG
jgi:uncharacterized protein